MPPCATWPPCCPSKSTAKTEKRQSLWTLCLINLSRLDSVWGLKSSEYVNMTIVVTPRIETGRPLVSDQGLTPAERREVSQNCVPATQ